MFLLFTPLFFNRIKFALLLILYPFCPQLLVQLRQAHQLLRVIPPAHLCIHAAQLHRCGQLEAVLEGIEVDWII